MSGAKFVGLLLLLAGIANAGITSRILNGQQAPLGRFPWMVSLRARVSSSHFCGGSLVTPQHVITAAHCVIGDAPGDIFVVTGSISNAEGGENHAVSDIRLHENYVGQSNYWQNDIAVLKLSVPVTLSAVRQILPLATKDPVNLEQCTMSGWGRAYYPSVGLPSYLQTFTQNNVDLPQCRAIWGANVIANNHLCGLSVLGEGMCSGDSGSPLVCDGEHAGVASWVSPCGNGLPDVYARVFYYVDWLREKISDIDD